MDEWRDKHGNTPGEFVRRFVHRVVVARAARPGARFDPARVSVTYADGTQADAKEIARAWTDMQALAAADALAAEQPTPTARRREERNRAARLGVVVTSNRTCRTQP